MSDYIGCALSTDKGLKNASITEEQLLILVESLKTNGHEWIRMSKGQSYMVDGVYIPGKGNRSVIMVLPMEDEDEKT